MPVYISHYPAGTSWKSIAHYAQILTSGRVAEYDYGHDGNLNIYGKSEPPLIYLDKISKVPIAYFVGKTDLIATPLDNRWALRKT